MLLVLLVTALVPPIRTNLTSVMLPSALLLAMIGVLMPRPRPGARLAVAMALLASALCSLKSTMIPVALATVGLAFVIDAIGARSMRTLLAGGASLLVTGLFLLPWMYAMHASCGTWLYPVLGKGYHLSALYPGISPAAQGNLRRMFPVCLVGLALIGCARIAIAVARRTSDPVFRLAQQGAVLFTACCLACGAFGAATGGYAWLRYTFPMLLPAIAMLLTLLLVSRDVSNEAARTIASAAAVLLIALLLLVPCRFYYRPLGPLTALDWSIRGVYLSRNYGDFFPPKLMRQMRDMQSVMPPGAKVLTRLNWPHLMDFHRNEVYLCDWPGMVSPPSPDGARTAQRSMPLDNPQALWDFLVMHGVQYVAFSYGDQCGMEPQLWTWATAPDAYPWLRVEYERAMRFQKTLMELGTLCLVLYDDGEIFVLDLGPAEPHKATY